MKLLNTLIDDTLDPNANLHATLLKARQLARQLGAEDFQRWLESELNGYKTPDDLPRYRRVNVENRGTFRLPDGIYRNAPVPVADTIEEWAVLALPHGVCALQDLL